MTIKGSCLCGGVAYEYDGEITEVAMCHCDQCKRAQGTPFVTNAPINFDSFRFSQGSDLISEFFSSPNKRRVFCRRCGSPIFSQRTDLPGTIRLRVGTVTEGEIPAPGYEIYCESRAEWFDGKADRNQFEKGKI